MRLRLFSLAWLLSALAVPGYGQGPLHNLGVETARNNCWPRPFTSWDRATVAAPMAVMIENGWRKQNVLADHHFDGSGMALNDAGKWRLRWILTEAPEQHRTVFVRRAESPEKTATRLVAVHQAAAAMLGPGEQPSIVETNIGPAGSPAERIDIIGRKFQASTPEPRLSKTGSSDSGGSSSGSGSR